MMLFLDNTVVNRLSNSIEHVMYCWMNKSNAFELML